MFFKHIKVEHCRTISLLLRCSIISEFPWAVFFYTSPFIKVKISPSSSSAIFMSLNLPNNVFSYVGNNNIWLFGGSYAWKVLGLQTVILTAESYLRGVTSALKALNFLACLLKDYLLWRNKNLNGIFIIFFKKYCIKYSIQCFLKRKNEASSVWRLIRVIGHGPNGVQKRI